MFNPFTCNVILDKAGFTLVILVFVFYMSHVNAPCQDEKFTFYYWFAESFNQESILSSIFPVPIEIIMLVNNFLK